MPMALPFDMVDRNLAEPLVGKGNQLQEPPDLRLSIAPERRLRVEKAQPQVIAAGN